MNMKTILTLAVGLNLSTLFAVAADAPKAPPPPPPTRVDPLKKYDKNGDGKLDDAEKAELRKDRAAQQKQAMTEALKKYDKNGNGKLDPDEAQARLDDIRKEREAALARQGKPEKRPPPPKDQKEPPKEEKK